MDDESHAVMDANANLSLSVADGTETFQLNATGINRVVTPTITTTDCNKFDKETHHKTRDGGTVGIWGSGCNSRIDCNCLSG